VVAALGFPETYAITQTVGRITRIEGGFLIFDAVIAPGSSGGPLVDKYGRMVGISRFIYEGEGYAVPVDTVLNTVSTWLDSLNLKKQWKRQQFANLGEHLFKDKRFIAGEILTGVAAYVVFGVIKPFEEPILPGPPALDEK
jgi:S1-C subfamily serine protease